MIFLFNKVHLKPDALYYKKQDRIIVSPRVTIDEDESWRGLSDSIFGKVHFRADSLKQLLDAEFDGDLNKMFAWMVAFDSSKRLEVHLAADDLLYVTATWYKTILPNITAVEAQRVFKLLYTRLSAVYGVPHHPQSHLRQTDMDVFKQIPECVLDKAKFGEFWDALTPLDIATFTTPEFIREQAAIEFQLASYYVDKDVEFADSLKTKVVRMVKKFQIRMAVEVKHLTLQQPTTLPGFDVQTTTIEGWVKNNPEYAFLDDDKFLPDYLDYIEATYDYKDIKQVCVDQWQRLEFKNINAAMAETHMFDPAITFDDIMANELKYVFGRQQLGWWEYHVFINTYLVDYILNLVRADDKVKLKLLSLL